MKARATALLQKALDNPSASFRDGQWEAVRALVEDRSRLLVVQRTGWGKSMVYFIATRLLRERGSGPTLLISPLLALMRNQILAARRLGIRAVTINSSNIEDWEPVTEALHKNEVDLLLISPERLANDSFREKTLRPVAATVGLLVVDEAHCISDWGHDFRPDYKRIVRILRALPRNVPVLTTTATANDRVVEDVVRQLGSNLHILRGPLARRSLRLQNISLPGQAARLAWLADAMKLLPGSGIIYTLTVRDAQHVADWMQSQGFDVHAYYGELDTDKREALETKLLRNEVKALAATSALGMGFDKSDLRFVIHFQRPGSVIHYYQQVGRAGRAVDEAYGILLCGEEDDEIADYFMRTALPPQTNVEDVIDALENADDGLSLRMLEQQLNLSYSRLQKVLTLLSVEESSPVIKLDSRWHRTAIPYTPDATYANKLLEIRRREQVCMQEYAQSRECLMAFLRRELDDPAAEPCGVCAVCRGEPLLPETYSMAAANAAVKFLRRCDESIIPRKMWHANALAAYGWKGRIAEELRAEQGRALCRWSDAGWGEMVVRGKFDGRYDDELVTGAAELIRERWQPDPFPEWIACVPSLRHPKLVPDFTKRLANALGLPFVDCLNKARETEPQKKMQNSFQQSRNLAGVFKINSDSVTARPVLLVDDMVDSGWTFTVLAAQLRQSNSGSVFPFALAKSSAK